MRTKATLIAIFALLFVGANLSPRTRGSEIAFEAEDVINIQPPMVIKEDKEASGGKYIVSPSEGVNGFVDYTIEIPEEGDWIVWGRVIAPDGDRDSFLIVGFDDTTTKPAYGDDQFRWTVRNTASWAWDQVNAVAGADPRVFRLTKGNHTLRIWNRENSTQLDVIFMTTDARLTEFDVDRLLKDTLARRVQKAVEFADKLATSWGSIKR